MEELLVGAMLSGQRNIKIEGIEFESLPLIKRDTQQCREIQAKKEAKKLINILNS
jgi:hypothetical protein